MNPLPFVIAEAGVNHNGDVGRAREMVAVAKEAGADCVKFQAFSPEGLVAAGAATAAYQAANTGVADQQDLLRSLALGRDDFEAIARHCADLKIEFFCTAFDVGFVETLIGFGMRRIKVASGEMTNTPALRHFATLGLPIVLSTGMATLDEVELATVTLTKVGARDITLMHCTSLYPAPDAAINLKAMMTMQQRFGLPVGYSDHSMGDHVSIAAVALGATVIEKHFTLDRSLPGPDHKASLEPRELVDFITKLRATATVLGDGIKQPVSAERATAQLVRRSWHAARPLAAGTVLTAVDAVLKRPASGLAPDVEIVGCRLARARGVDEPIRAADLA